MSLQHEITAFAGWNRNLKISNGACELIITLEVGPRLLHFAPPGGQSVFKLFDEQLGQSGEAGWQSRGGHRLWLGPEAFPFSYFADNGFVDHTIWPNGAVTLSTPPEPSGFQKQMDVTMDEKAAKVRVNHRIINAGEKAGRVAAWMLSVMAPGGVCLMPQPMSKAHPGLGPGDFAPDRTMVLWPFTDLSDGRWFLGKQFWTLRQDENLGATKMGLNNGMPWAAYFLNGTLFAKKFPHEPHGIYPDRNSNFEAFSNEEMLEIETLGPIHTLEPGESLEQVEEWELFTGVPAFDARDDASIGAALGSVGLV